MAGRSGNRQSVKAEAEKATHWTVEFPGDSARRHVYPDIVNQELVLFDTSKGDGNRFTKDAAATPVGKYSLKSEDSGLTENEYYKFTQDSNQSTEDDRNGASIKVEKAEKGKDGSEKVKELLFTFNNAYKREVAELWHNIAKLKHRQVHEHKKQTLDCIDNSGVWAQFDRIKPVKAGFYGKVPWSDKPVRVAGKLAKNAILEVAGEDVVINDYAKTEGGYSLEVNRAGVAFQGTVDESGTVSFSDSAQSKLYKGIYMLVHAKWKDEQAQFLRLEPKLVPQDSKDSSCNLRQQLLLKEDKDQKTSTLQVMFEEILPLQAIDGEKKLEGLLQKKSTSSFAKSPFGKLLEFDINELQNREVVCQKGKDFVIPGTGVAIKGKRTVPEFKEEALTFAEFQQRVQSTAKSALAGKSDAELKALWTSYKEKDKDEARRIVPEFSNEAMTLFEFTHRLRLREKSDAQLEKYWESCRVAEDNPSKVRIRIRRTYWADEPVQASASAQEAASTSPEPPTRSVAENGGPSPTRSSQAAVPPARRSVAKKELPASAPAPAPAPTPAPAPAPAPTQSKKDSPTSRGRKSQPGNARENPEEEIPQPRGQSPSAEDSPIAQLFTTADAFKLLKSQENEQYRSLTAKQVADIFAGARSDRLTFEQLEEEVNRFLQLQQEAQEEKQAPKQGSARSPDAVRSAPPRSAASPPRQRSPPRSAVSPPRSPQSGSRSPNTWAPSPQSPRKLAPGEVHDHTDRLHAMHKAKMDKLQRLRDDQELKEARRIQEEANQRRPIRTKLQGQPFDPYDLTDRLHKEHRAIKQRHEVLGRRFKENEQSTIESTRTRPKPPEEKSEKEIDEIVSRLNQWDEHRRKKLGQEVDRKAEEEKGLIKYGVSGEAVDGSAKQHALQKSHALYDEAQQRQAALRRREEEVKTQERLQLSQASIHKEEDRSVNMERIEQLHKDAEERAEKLKKLQKSEEDRALQNITQQKQKLKEVCDSVKTKECKDVSTRYEDHIPKHRDPAKIKEKEAVEKALNDKFLPKQLTPMSIIHHVLSTLNTALANRCGNTPEDAPTQELSELGALLKVVMQKFKDAGTLSDINAEGGANLRNLKNKSLYSDGQLMDDSDGWARCCAPDPIRQLHADLDNLLSVARKAQAVLQLNFMNDQPKDMDAIDKSWPADSMYNKPKAFPVVKFAFNPGPKPRQSILTKATVQYGPAEGQRRYMHCLDMARLSLVCESSAALRLTLEHICERFEVVLVRSHYQPHMAGLLGDKYVEVLVVLKQGLPFPMVCEIRLEEQCFFEARNSAKSVLDKVAKGFASIYMRDGISSGNLEYFVKWLLMKPKAVHALTVFRRQLARRYSSSVVAWRQLFSGGKDSPQVHMSFQTFREVCGHLNHRSRAVEFWQELDSTGSGRVCIFDIDDEAVFLMVKFLGRLVALMSEPDRADGEALFQMMAHKALVKLSRANMMDNSEFRMCTKPLGFNQTEADRLFLYLDGHGGSKVQPPATICPADMDWLKNRLPRLVDIPSVLLSAADSQTAPFRQLMNWAEATKADDMNRNELTLEPIAKKLQRHESICIAREMSETGTHRLSLPAGAMGEKLEALWAKGRSQGEIADGDDGEARPRASSKATAKAAGKAAAKASAALASVAAAPEAAEDEEEWVDGQDEEAADEAADEGVEEEEVEQEGVEEEEEEQAEEGDDFPQDESF